MSQLNFLDLERCVEFETDDSDGYLRLWMMDQWDANFSSICKRNLIVIDDKSHHGYNGVFPVSITTELDGVTILIKFAFDSIMTNDNIKHYIAEDRKRKVKTLLNEYN